MHKNLNVLSSQPHRHNYYFVGHVIVKEQNQSPDQYLIAPFIGYILYFSMMESKWSSI